MVDLAVADMIKSVAPHYHSKESLGLPPSVKRRPGHEDESFT